MTNDKKADSKNVFIITRHAVCNYGSVLQTIATQSFFEERGFSSKIIDYQSSEETIIRNLLNYSKNRGLRGIKRLLYCVAKWPDEVGKSILFGKMRRKYLRMTKKEKSLASNNGLFDDAILCSGGDQLWGFMPNSAIDKNYYLEFGNRTNAYISFSSSFGRYDFSNEEIELIRRYLMKYKFITVRENSAVSFLGSLGIESTCVLDPTLLVHKSKWIGMCSNRPLKKKFVLVYKLRQDNILNEIAIKIAKERNLPIIFITNSHFYREKQGKVLVNPRMDYVLQLFRDCDAVITDSFHANVLSVIFEKNYYIHLPGKTNSRIVDFNNFLGLGSRIIDDAENVNNNSQIDYSKVNIILETKRKQDIKTLESLLEAL